MVDRDALLGKTSAMFHFGPWEIGLILAMAFFIYGPKRLLQMGKGIGQFVKNTIKFKPNR